MITEWLQLWTVEAAIVFNYALIQLGGGYEPRIFPRLTMGDIAICVQIILYN